MVARDGKTGGSVKVFQLGRTGDTEKRIPSRLSISENGQKKA